MYGELRYIVKTFYCPHYKIEVKKWKKLTNVVPLV